MRDEYAQAVRHELLKSTYRLDRDTSGDLYKAAKTAADRLGHDAPVTLYQAQNAKGLNASLAWLPGELHVVLHGPVQETLSEPELIALFGHEIAHHLLFSIDAGAYLMVEQVLTAMLGDRAASHAHEQTWKHFKLYTELFCDRMALGDDRRSGDLRLDAGEDGDRPEERQRRRLLEAGRRSAARQYRRPAKGSRIPKCSFAPRAATLGARSETGRCRARVDHSKVR